MMTFLAYTIMAIIANACMAKILHVSIQPGQWLDNLLHWQQRLREWDINGNVILAKALGYCELCFSHLVSVTGFMIYLSFMLLNDLWVLGMYSSMIWYLLYVAVTTNVSLYFIVKLFEKK